MSKEELLPLQNSAESSDEKKPEEYISEELIAHEEELLSGLPKINLGAFLMPPIWGPAHGLWITILYYPAWLFADNTFYAAITDPNAMSIIFALIIAVSLFFVTLIFGRLSQPYAIHRAIDKGKTKTQFAKEQKIWVFVSSLIALLMIVWATIFNLFIR